MVPNVNVLVQIMAPNLVGTLSDEYNRGSYLMGLTPIPSKAQSAQPLEIPYRAKNLHPVYSTVLLESKYMQRNQKV